MAEQLAFDIAKGLVSELSSPVLEQLGLWWNFKDDLEELKNTISAIKAVLLDAEEKSVTSNLVRDWLAKLKEALYDAEDLLDDVHTEALRKKLMSGNKLTKEVRVFFSKSNQLTYGLKMGRRIKAIKARLSSIQSQIILLNLVPCDHVLETSFMARRRQQTHSFVLKDEIIGREGDKAALLKLLLDTEFESEENVAIVPIVGFGGLGKTALAQFVYNDKMVEDQFELRMWICVSDVFDVKVIVGNIIKSVTNEVPDQHLEMDQLQKQLRDKIAGKKYFLVLDDLWNEKREQWVSLKMLLMGGAKGSRIIVTTRSLRVAKITGTCQPHVLKGLSDTAAWSLFKQIAFEQRSVDSKNPSFVEIGNQILRKCDGVPLVIRTIAGTLSFKETETEWLSFKDHELSRISQTEGEILPTLKLSFDHLPSHLKHCFAYCRLYPKDHIIYVQTLVHFWIAQGFVQQPNTSQSLEEIGFGYFKDLAERCFFQEVIEYWGGEIECKMHDCMHDLAEKVSGKESGVLNSNSSTREVDDKCRHISVDFSLIPLLKGKKLRTLLHFPNKKVFSLSDVTWNSIISNGRSLRVLELNDLNLNTVSNSIHKLKHLRYLDLSGNESLKFLPLSICKIQNLQVLKLDWCRELEELPKKIEKLVNLTHLPCDRCWGLTHMPRGIGKLTSLQTLSMFVVDKDGSHGAAAANLSVLSGLNRLRGELTIRNLGFVRNAKEEFKAANLKGKEHLQSLVLKWGGDTDDDEEKSLEDLQPHPNLKKLWVETWRGDAKFPTWISLLKNLTDIGITGPSKFKHLTSFAQLPHLQSLLISELTELEYIEDNVPSGGQGEAEPFFPSLMSLQLNLCPNMKSWWKRPVDNDKDDDEDTTVIGTSTIAFPCLSFLWIEDCPLLSSMPLYPSLDKELKLVNTSSRPLKKSIQMNTTATTSSLPLSKLKSFHVENCSRLRSLFPGFQHLTSLEHLNIRNCEELELSADGFQIFQNHTSLRSLDLENIPKCLNLPKSIKHLTNLKYLDLVNLANLTSLPDEMHCLTSLEELYIHDIPQLEERCRKDMGVDWHKIAHIPYIRMNGRRLQ